MRIMSPVRNGGQRSSMWWVNSSPLRLAWWLVTIDTPSMRDARLNEDFSTTSPPDSILARSRMSPMEDDNIPPATSRSFMIERCSWLSGVEFRRSAMPSRPLRGVLIWCDMVRRNSPFALLASSAAVAWAFLRTRRATAYPPTIPRAKASSSKTIMTGRLIVMGRNIAERLHKFKKTIIAR